MVGGDDVLCRQMASEGQRVSPMASADPEAPSSLWPFSCAPTQPGSMGTDRGPKVGLGQAVGTYYLSVHLNDVRDRALGLRSLRPSPPAPHPLPSVITLSKPHT